MHDPQFQDRFPGCRRPSTARTHAEPINVRRRRPGPPRKAPTLVNTVTSAARTRPRRRPYRRAPLIRRHLTVALKSDACPSRPRVRPFVAITRRDVKAFMGDALPTRDRPRPMRWPRRYERVRIMDEGGVRQAVVIPGHGYPARTASRTRVPSTTASPLPGHAHRSVPVCRRRGEPRTRPTACPSSIGANRSSASRASAFTRASRAIDGQSVDPQYVARMGELGMVPVLHAMTESPDEALWKTAQIARAFPDLKMLVLDSFSTFEGTKEQRHRRDVPNLLFDTSLSYNFDSSRSLRSVSAPSAWSSVPISTRASRPAHQPSRSADHRVVVVARRQGQDLRREPASLVRVS